MILYLDASALVKRYVEETGSEAVRVAIAESDAVATVSICRAEVVAALAKAVRMQALVPAEADLCVQRFRNDWPHLVRIQVTELLVARADDYAWRYGLEGYDAVHVAAATLWQDAMGEQVMIATFDQKMWECAEWIGLRPFPPDLPKLLAQRRPV